MEINQDFSDLFAEFNAHDVDYLVVGAHALAAHGHVRATKDVDIWVRPSRENAEKVHRALAAFGAPMDQVQISDFAEPGLIFQIGVEPLRIDVLTAIDGLQFDEAWDNRVATHFGPHSCHVLSRSDLILNKRASGRSQDLADIERLSQAEDSE